LNDRKTNIVLVISSASANPENLVNIFPVSPEITPTHLHVGVGPLQNNRNKITAKYIALAADRRRGLNKLGRFCWRLSEKHE